MNIKLHEVLSLYYELNGVVKTVENQTDVISQGILKQKMSLKFKIYLQRLNKIVSDEFNLFEEAKKDLFQKYGEEKDGIFFIKKENEDLFRQELDDILNSEKAIDVYSLWSSDLTLDNLSSIETNEYYPILFKLIDK
jgi:hypothetical protein